jgi:hypothetical protein
MSVDTRFNANGKSPPAYEFEFVVDDDRHAERKDEQRSGRLVEFARAQSAAANFSTKARLAEPNAKAFTPEDWAITVGALSTQVSEEQMDTSIEAIELNTFVKAALTKEIERQNAEALKKAEEAKAVAESKKHLDWAMAGLALFGAIAITVLTGGTAVGLAVGIVGIALASLAVANEVVKDQKVMDPNNPDQLLDLSIGGMTNAITDWRVRSGNIVQVDHKDSAGRCYDKNNNLIAQEWDKQYKTAEELESFKKDWALAANVIVISVMILAGGKGAYNAHKAAGAAANVGDKIVKGASTAERAGQAVTAGAGVAAGGVQVHSGTLTAEVAVSEEEAAKAAAKKKIFEAMLKTAGAEQALIHDVLKQAMARMAENYQAVSSMLADVNSNRQLIARINLT